MICNVECEEYQASHMTTWVFAIEIDHVTVMKYFVRYVTPANLCWPIIGKHNGEKTNVNFFEVTQIYYVPYFVEMEKMCKTEKKKKKF